MNITYFWADLPEEKNTSFWRAIIPHNAMLKAGHQSTLVHISHLDQNTPQAFNACSQADIIVIERNLWGGVINAIVYWKSKGKTIIANFDDAYQLMTHTNSSYKWWYEGLAIGKDKDGKDIKMFMKPLPIDQFKAGLSLCDAIITPSQVLCDDWSYLSPAYLVPNYFNTERYVPVVDKEKIIGWGGSLSHFQSFERSGVRQALQLICKKYKDVKVMIVGDKRIFDLVDLPLEQKLFNNYVPFEQWPALVAKFAIGLAPLRGEYDQRRSWIKPLEYSLLRIPWIASESQAYSMLEGTFVKNTVDDWYSAIEDKLLNSGKLPGFTQVNKAEKFAREQDVSLHVDEMVNLFQRIRDGRQ